MLHMIVAGICLCIGFTIGKKIVNEVEYHGYLQGEKLKEKFGPIVKEKTNWLIGSLKGALQYQLEQARKGREKYEQMKKEKTQQQ